MKHLLGILALALVAVAALHAPLDAQKARKDRNRISEEEIHASSAANAYDLIRSVRSQWLRVRGQASLQTVRTTDPVSQQPMSTLAPQEIVVYVDGSRFGNQNELRSLSTHDLASLEYMDPSTATQRWGTGHPYGAILATRKR